jgi:hypothetical protein
MACGAPLARLNQMVTSGEYKKSVGNGGRTTAGVVREL